jgi:hypothetical protein
MRRTILTTILAAAAVTTVSTPSSAAYRENTQPYCYFGYGCVPMTAARYNACYNLALRRGQSPARWDRKSREFFIYQCLAGKIPF